ncbi:MAG TPA: TolC family protein [Terracidiphilus sp.]|jgi:outer membrane protein TolC
MKNWPRLLLLLSSILVSPAATPAQEPVRLTLQQAIALAISPRGTAAVQLAEAAQSAAKARISLAHSYRYPLFSFGISESNVTRNLGAEGFNFPTGVPGFVIPQSVGPFNIFDARIEMTQTLFDLSAIRRSRAITAAFDAAASESTVNREAAAAQAAHDYLVALHADASVETATGGVTRAEAMIHRAQDRVDAGKASDAEMDRARLHRAAARTTLSNAQRDATDARLQLLNDLGLDFTASLELTDKLTYSSAADSHADLKAAIDQALANRAELKTGAARQAQARDEAAAVHAGALPTVQAYGDVGPQGEVITHTVGVSARITVFDGGRRRAQEAESAAAVHQYDIQQHDLRRQIELEVRRAFANLQAAAAAAQNADEALKLSQEEVARAQRRYDNGVADNSELLDAQAAETQAKEDQLRAWFTWNQSRLEMSQSTGTAEQMSMK